MGNLKPGAEYIYTQKEGNVYQRERGSPDEELIGWKYDPRTDDGRPLIDHLKDNQLWSNIRRAAENDSGLRELLERAKIYYHLKYKNAK